MSGIPFIASGLTGCGGASAAEVDEQPVSSVEITSTPFSVAVVSAEASPELNITAGITKLIALMQEAKSAGARLITCGELWLPGYPVQLNFQADWRDTNWASYVENSITVGDANWLRIVTAARDIGIFVCFGFSEIDGNYAYISQALIGEDGAVLAKRRKVRPSGSERNFWSDAPMEGNFPVVTTALGRISMLACWDHLRPQSTFNVMAQLPNIHVCAWPYVGETTASTQWWEREEVAHTAAAYFSQLTGAVTVLPAVGHIGVYERSQKKAVLLAGSGQSMLLYTVNPTGWSGASGNTNSEFSYGVLQMLSENYPGQKVADPERSVLRLNPLV